MDENAKRVLQRYTLDAVSILRHSVDMMDGGFESFYRVAAVQMRILLCDTTFRHNRVEDIAVLPILFPHLKLPPLEAAPGSESRDWLDLEAWLSQPASPCSEMSVRQMIRRICDVDGGAHVDLKPVNGIPLGCEQAQWIKNLARILLPELDRALGNQS